MTRSERITRVEAYWKRRYMSERAWSRYWQRCYESERTDHNVTVWLIVASAIVILIVASLMAGGTP